MLLVYWVYVSAIIVIYGVFFEEILCRFFRLKKSHQLHLSYTFVSGLVFLSTIGTWFSIYYRLNIEFNLILLIGTFIILYIYQAELIRRKDSLLKALRNTSWHIKLIFGLAVLIANTGSCVDSIWNYDNGVYYVQYVKWIETHAVVPGLGNIYPYFAYNSTWHILTAVFSFSFLDDDIKFDDLNGLLWLFMVLRSLHSLDKIGKRNASFTDYFTVFMPVPIYVMRYYFNAAFADFTIMCLIFMVLSLVIEIIEQQYWGRVELPTVLSGIFSFYMLTVKLSAIMILTPTLLLTFLLIRHQRYMVILRACGLVLIMIIPWLLRCYYMSGYLIFPFHQLDLFNPDWKVTVETSIYFQSEIESYSKVPNYDYPIFKVLNYTVPFAWIPEWFSLMKHYDKIILIGLSISILGFSSIYFYQIISKKSIKNTYFPIFVTILGGLLLWFLKAPSPRFGYGWIFSFLFFVGASVCYFLKDKIHKLPSIFMIIMLLWAGKVSHDNLNELYCFAGDCFYLHGQFKMPRAEVHREMLNILFGKTPKTRVPPLKTYPFGKFTFYMPARRDVYYRALCWDAPLPCSLYDLNTRVLLRGTTLQEGFKVKYK